MIRLALVSEESRDHRKAIKFSKRSHESENEGERNAYESSRWDRASMTLKERCSDQNERERGGCEGWSEATSASS
jgi:hypothetical protein